MTRGVFAATLVAIALTGDVASAQPKPAPTADAPAALGGFSVDMALAAMKREQPLLRAASSAVRVAEGNAITLGHWTNPALDATYLKAIRNSSYDQLGAPSVGVTQFLEVAGAPAARRRSARAEVHATEADRDALARELEWAVREAFVRLVATYERERIRRSVVGDLEHAATIVRLRVGGGLAPRYDASRIEIALEQARADLADASANIVRARGELDVVVGPASRELVGPPRFDLFTPPAVPPIGPQEAAAAHRPDVVAAQKRVEAASHDIEAAHRSVFPGLGLRVGAGYGQAPGQVDLSVGVVVPLPVIERGQGTVAAAQARADENQERAYALSFAVGQRIRSAHAELALRVDSLAHYRDHMRTLNDSTRSEAEAGYRDAKLSVLELVDAYQSLRDAHLRLVDLSEAAHLAKVGLGRSAGSDGAAP